VSFIHERTTKTILWLDFYGLCREACLTPYTTQQFLDGDSEMVSAAMAETALNAGAKDAKNQAITDNVGNAIMGVGAAIVGIVGETGIGAIVGIVVAAVGVLLKYLARLFYVECDKYHCGGHDQDSDYKRRKYREHQYGLVGVYLPEKRRSDAEANCSCKLRGHECSFVRYLHDGMMVDGINIGQMEDSKVKTGRVRGVNALASGANAGCTEYWRKHEKAKPLDEHGDELPAGNPAVKKVYKNKPGTYYRRSWRVRELLAWMQTKMLCRTMECMEEVLLSTTGIEGDSEFNQTRRRGSRWYSSIVWMMKDVWENGQKLGYERLATIAIKAGANKEALDVLREMKAKKKFDENELPWIWWPFLKHFSWWQLRAMLIDMKDEFHYQSPIEAGRRCAIEGETARKKSITTKSMVAAITTSVMFTPKMQPIPAKIGSRGPGWGILAFGGIAALIGGYTIYKVVSDKDE